MEAMLGSLGTISMSLYVVKAPKEASQQTSELDLLTKDNQV